MEEEIQHRQASMIQAGFWMRCLAFLLDAIALYSLSIIVRLIAGQSADNPSFAFSLFEYSYFLVYYIAMTTAFGQTLGKMVMGIHVIQKEKQHSNFLGIIIYRELIGKLLSLVTFGIGFLMAGWSREKQALHDLMAETYVIIIPEREENHERASTQQTSERSSLSETE